MKIQVASDVHLEFFREHDDLPKVEKLGNVLALVGDIGYPKRDTFEKYVTEHATRFEHVFLIAGNHEFYTSEYYETIKQMEDLAEKIENVHFMNKSSFLYVNPEDSTDVVRILGATLWSNVPDEHVSFISRALNDYHICTINDNGSKRKLSVADTNKWHKEDVTYLTEEIQKAQENNENIVILTHHAPLTENTSAPHFKGSQGNYAFATDLSSMMKHHVVLWLFGHTHYSSEQIEPNSGTMVASNQMGYRHERGAGYRPELVYDVPSRANDTRVAPTGDGKCALTSVFSD